MKRRNIRRTKRNDHDEAAKIAASVAFGAIMKKIIDHAIGDDDDKGESEPFSGIRKVSDNEYVSGIRIPNDGTAKEIPIPEGFDVFISEEGKPMIRRKEGFEDGGEEQPITYETIARRLFAGEKNPLAPDQCVTKAQIDRLFAFNKLQNIATYLNDGWHPDANDQFERKFYLYKTADGRFTVSHNTCMVTESTYFKTQELAMEAIRIMGEESLNDLFNTNW